MGPHRRGVSLRVKAIEPREKVWVELQINLPSLIILPLFPLPFFFPTLRRPCIKIVADL